MDTQTRHALKKDSFVTATHDSLNWAQENRERVLALSIAVVAAIVIAIGGALIYQHRSDAAAADFSHAMRVYQAPLSTSAEPIAPGIQSFPSAAARAKAANQLFLQAADRYGMLADGRNARYFAGLTYIEMGENASAESTLKSVADSWDHDLASLANLALAGLYHQTGRDPQAIDLLNQLAAKPTATVPAGVAKLQLAQLYEAANQPEQAKRIYAQLKDEDKTGAAGQIAAQKLSGPQQP